MGGIGSAELTRKVALVHIHCVVIDRVKIQVSDLALPPYSLILEHQKFRISQSLQISFQEKWRDI